MPPPVPAPAPQQLAKQLHGPNIFASSIFPSCCRHLLPTVPSQSTPILYIPFQLPPPLPDPALKQLAKQLQRSYLRPPAAFPSGCHLPFQLSRSDLLLLSCIPFLLPPTVPTPAVQQLAKLLHRPNLVTPCAFVSGCQASLKLSRPNSTPTPYIPFPLPPPLPAPALQ